MEGLYDDEDGIRDYRHHHSLIQTLINGIKKVFSLIRELLKK